MSNLNLNQLIQKLQPEVRQALERATQDCVQQKQAEVQPEHWLLQLLPLITDREVWAIDLIAWQEAIRVHLQQHTATTQGVPKLSAWLVQLLQDCALQAAVELNLSSITAPLVLYTFAKAMAEQLWPQHACHQALLNLNLDAIKNSLLNQPSASALPTAPSDALKRFTTDLTQQARDGKLDAVIGRERELRQMMDILTRRRQNNPILVGEAGVGKTALAEGLALRIIERDVPPALIDVSLLSLDLAALQAGTGVQGEFEQRLKDLILAIKQYPNPVILFIDEAHNLIGAGGQQGHGDAANLLKPLLARGELRTIAATTWIEYKKYIENDAALMRRFETVRVLEPDEVTANDMLMAVAPKLEQHHQVFMTPEAIRAAVTLSSRYLPERQLPDKAISLLDTASARVQLSQHATPSTIMMTQQSIAQLSAQLARLQRSETLGEATSVEQQALQVQLDAQQDLLTRLTTQWQQEQNLIKELMTCRSQLFKQKSTDENQVLLQKQYQNNYQQLQALQGENGLINLQVDASTVAQVIADWTGIPAGRLLRSELNTTLNLTAELEQRVLGQSQAITLLGKKLQTARVNLQDPHKPQGVFLLVGQSGTGKTETAYAVSELLYGGRQHLSVVNMSEFKESHKVSMLTGAPAGYVGYGEGGILTEAIRRRPYGVVLLDEMEKSHPSIQDVFYQVFDKGMLMDGQGREIDCRHTVFLMTSNAGVNTDELLNYFKPAFLARLTVLAYHPLALDVLAGIVRMKLQQVVQRLQQQHHITLNYSQNLVQQLAVEASTHLSHARRIDQVLEAELLPALSQQVMLMLLQETAQAKSITLDFDQGNYCVTN